MFVYSSENKSFITNSYKYDQVGAYKMYNLLLDLKFTYTINICSISNGFYICWQ